MLGYLVMAPLLDYFGRVKTLTGAYSITGGSIIISSLITYFFPDVAFLGTVCRVLGKLSSTTCGLKSFQPSKIFISFHRKNVQCSYIRCCFQLYCWIISNSFENNRSWNWFFRCSYRWNLGSTNSLSSSYKRHFAAYHNWYLLMLCCVYQVIRSIIFKRHHRLWFKVYGS